MKVLVIAPHPDDEVLGCGGTVAKAGKRGDELSRCIVTKAYAPDWSQDFLATRPQEIEKAGTILGFKKTCCLDFPTAQLDTVPQKELVAALRGVIDEVQADVLYLPHRGDIHSDHRLVFEAGLTAAKLSKKLIAKILCYETVSETEWGKSIGPFIPTVYVDVSQTFSLKTEAMQAYASELRPAPHARSLEGIKSLAQMRGCEVAVEMAESFALIRAVCL